MPKGHILIVEDSTLQAEVTRDFLVRQGYEATCVHNGVTALTTVRTTPIDIILLDLILPDINGKEVCRQLKTNHDTRGIPIIMLTVKDSVEDKVSGIEAGADDYLPKPYNEVELNARIYAALRNKALQDELRRKNRQMEELLSRVEVLAITDPLTGLYNRRRIEGVLDDEWKAHKRYKTPLSCIIIDADHFKLINDTYGHKTGDVVLKEVAGVIKGCLREVDTVARWGGEEFIAVLPQTDGNGAVIVAKRIKDRIAATKFESMPGRQVTVSIGIASAGDGLDTPDKLVNAADGALYGAKASGRNTIGLTNE